MNIKEFFSLFLVCLFGTAYLTAQVPVRNISYSQTACMDQITEKCPCGCNRDGKNR